MINLLNDFVHFFGVFAFILGIVIMTVEEKSQATQVLAKVAVTKEEVLKEEKEMEKVQQVKDVTDGDECKEGKMVEKSSSYRE